MFRSLMRSSGRFLFYSSLRSLRLKTIQSKHVGVNPKVFEVTLMYTQKTDTSVYEKCIGWYK